MTQTKNNLRAHRTLGVLLAGGIAAVLASGAAANDSTTIQLAQANTNAAEAEKKAKQKAMDDARARQQQHSKEQGQPAAKSGNAQTYDAAKERQQQRSQQQQNSTDKARERQKAADPYEAARERQKKADPYEAARERQEKQNDDRRGAEQKARERQKAADPYEAARERQKKVDPTEAARERQQKENDDRRGAEEKARERQKAADPYDAARERQKKADPEEAARERQEKQFDDRRDAESAARARQEARGERPYARPIDSRQKIDDVQRLRKKTVQDGGKRVIIRESDKRIIVKDNNRYFIQHDQSERLRRLNSGARTNIVKGGYRETVIVRPNGVKVVDVTDKYGRIVHRYRVLPGGDRVTIIDNRAYWRRQKRNNYGRDIALGVGAGILIGAAVVALAPPAIAIPRDDYIVDYEDASDDDIYDAFRAPPVEDLGRRYSLEEVRYSDSLRQRMRRVDVDTVTFDFGSWEVGPEQYPALERIARGINRVINENPDEVFLVEGHTDAVGSEEDNLSLSDRRAQNVAEVLSSEFDVPPENIVTQGYGEQFLKVETGGPERRNRRITVRRITPLLAESEREEDYDRR